MRNQIRLGQKPAGIVWCFLPRSWGSSYRCLWLWPLQTVVREIYKISKGCRRADVELRFKSSYSWWLTCECRIFRIQIPVPVPKRCGMQRQKQGLEVAAFLVGFPLVSFIVGPEALKSMEILLQQLARRVSHGLGLSHLVRWLWTVSLPTGVNRASR